MTSSHPPHEPDEVARLTSRAAELLEAVWGQTPTAPVSPSQLPVLLVLEHHEGINLRTLADTLGSTPPSASRLCDRLQAVGFLERAPSPNSRREVHLYLTKPGRAFLAEVRARRERELTALLTRMPAHKRSVLLEGLEAFRWSAAARIHEDRPSDSRSA
ncbi:MarR family transcriptional regulator [Streptomyces sp. ICBB 8177]|uniref:MarR family winged helix-turn-helix transcriptional regulator n=1 Tax=Streptomyces sp. ICBB 8177 TaxID=563922 RepID=UPI000D67AC79|nr:MarR family transcriptional regulator [Streptomyces sp. ICBB 8177]PWI44803.1 MarR family transcriptional regulator [Streptomyces sp. ICBB 8177]